MGGMSLGLEGNQTTFVGEHPPNKLGLITLGCTFLNPWPGLQSIKKRLGYYYHHSLPKECHDPNCVKGSFQVNIWGLLDFDLGLLVGIRRWLLGEQPPINTDGFMGNIKGHSQPSVL